MGKTILVGVDHVQFEDGQRIGDYKGNDITIHAPLETQPEVLWLLKAVRAPSIVGNQVIEDQKITPVTGVTVAVLKQETTIETAMTMLRQMVDDRDKALEAEFHIRRQELLEVLNAAWKTLLPVPLKEFNEKLYAGDLHALLQLEQRDDRIGLASAIGDPLHKPIGMSVASLVATITDVLVCKRLAMIIEELDTNEGRQQCVTGFMWYNPVVEKTEEESAGE